MRRPSLFILFALLCSSMAFATSGRFGTANGGDPTDISSNGGTFTFNPINGGGVFDYHNIGPGAITDITVLLTAFADPNYSPVGFSSAAVAPTSGEKSVLQVTGFEQSPTLGGQAFFDWTFYSYIFSQITVTKFFTNTTCDGTANTAASCLTIDFTNGSIPVGGFFGFDLNDNFTADICTPNTDTNCTIGSFLPDAGTNPPSGGFGNVTVASGSVNGTGSVPEPVTFGLMGIAGLIFLGLRRRQFSRN